MFILTKRTCLPAIALRHELRLPLLLGLLDNQSHNHEQMDVFHLLLG